MDVGDIAQQSEKRATEMTTQQQSKIVVPMAVNENTMTYGNLEG